MYYDIIIHVLVDTHRIGQFPGGDGQLLTGLIVGYCYRLQVSLRFLQAVHPNQKTL